MRESSRIKTALRMGRLATIKTLAGFDFSFWRMSGHPAVQQGLRNPFFDTLGLPRLYVPAQ